MKKMILVLAATMIMAGGSVMAAEHAPGTHDAKCLKECQMLVKDCGQEVDSLQQRISRLKGELGKGTSVYSADEMRMLERKLKETEDLLTNLTYGG